MVYATGGRKIPLLRWREGHLVGVRLASRGDPDIGRSKEKKKRSRKGGGIGFGGTGGCWGFLDDWRGHVLTFTE